MPTVDDPLVMSMYLYVKCVQRIPVYIPLCCRLYETVQTKKLSGKLV